MTDGSPSESRAASAGVAGEDRHPAQGLVALLVERSVDDDLPLPHEVGAVGEVACLESVELLVGHLRRPGRASQHHDRVDVELVGDVMVARHSSAPLLSRTGDHAVAAAAVPAAVAGQRPVEPAGSPPAASASDRLWPHRRSPRVGQKGSGRPDGVRSSSSTGRRTCSWRIWIWVLVIWVASSGLTPAKARSASAESVPLLVRAPAPRARGTGGGAEAGDHSDRRGGVVSKGRHAQVPLPPEPTVVPHSARRLPERISRALSDRGGAVRSRGERPPTRGATNDRR